MVDPFGLPGPAGVTPRTTIDKRRTSWPPNIDGSTAGGAWNLMPPAIHFSIEVLTGSYACFVRLNVTRLH